MGEIQKLQDEIYQKNKEINKLEINSQNLKVKLDETLNESYDIKN